MTSFTTEPEDRLHDYQGLCHHPTRPDPFRQRGTLTGDQTPIVMLHQTASSSQCGRKSSPTSMERADIAFDTPGFGNSFDPEGYLSIGELSEVIVHACNDLGIEHFTCLAITPASVSLLKLRSLTPREHSPS